MKNETTLLMLLKLFLAAPFIVAFFALEVVSTLSSWAAEKVRDSVGEVR